MVRPALLLFRPLFTVVIKKSKHKKEKQNVKRKHKPHLFLNTQRCSQNYTIRTCWHPFFQFNLSECNKNTAFVVQ
jgi:hypothetical protein